MNSFNPILDRLGAVERLYIRQKRELAEFVGFETRNKYAIEDQAGNPVAFAAEQQKGFFGFIFRQFLGHFRSFTITIFDNERQPRYEARHPFRWYFQELQVSAFQGQPLGSLKKRFSLFSKRFVLTDHKGEVLLTVSSPLWRIWTFKFENRNSEVCAQINKKWGGLLREGFTDQDRFELEFTDRRLSAAERVLLICAAIFVDLNYLENKATGAGDLLSKIPG